MIKFTSGNLLESDAEALVNTVNCVGVMGKGIALQFKQAFPENYKAYAKACKKGEVRTGRMFIYRAGDIFNPKYIVNFPTKRHWKAKSRLDDVKSGLEDLVNQVQRLNIKTIAIPPLGAGLGGLRWQDVKEMIVNAFEESTVQVLLYEPKGSPASDKIKIATKRPNMTKGRALLIKLLDQYRNQGYRHSLLEIQKLMYFTQQAGEDLKLNYTKYKFGPYAENLNHVLQAIDGHFIRGYGDRKSKSEIYLIEEAVEKADEYLYNNSDANKHLEKVKRLITGFETPYGLELLSTVHWTLKEQPESKDDPDKLFTEIQNWNKRKKQIVKKNHVLKALKKLKMENWITNGDQELQSVTTSA
jgi:O-acetyl-ADP-ribose deacetylase (regulator of RNase III)